MAEADLPKVSEKFPEFTDFFHRDITGRNDVKLEKIGDPYGIFIVGLLALNSPDIFRGVDNDMEVPFKEIEDGNPVFTGGFHTDFGTAVTQEPVTAGNEAGVESGEPLFPVSGDVFEISRCDADSDKFFVDVHTGTC